MEVSNDLVKSAKKFLSGIFSLARIEAREAFSAGGLKALWYFVAGLMFVLAAAWLSVAIFLALVGAAFNPLSSSLLLAGSFVVLTLLCIMFSLRVSLNPSKSLQDALEEFAHKEQLAEASVELKDAAVDVLNPVKIVSKSIVKNPVTFLVGGAALGLAMGAKEAKKKNSYQEGVL